MNYHEPFANLLEAALRAEIPGFSRIHYSRTWSELELDSFGLLALRASVEQALGHEIEDEDWVAAATPEDVIRLATDRSRAERSSGDSAFLLMESVELGLPQMALSGLSEGWLLRSLGDLHWRAIAESMEVKPADVHDGQGNRLYPAFTRLRFVSDRPLAAYREGDNLLFKASLSRFGAGLFFSRIEVEGERDSSIGAELMSTFAHRGTAGTNSDLLRGQPEAAAHCRAPRLDEMPLFGLVYQERRRDSAAAKAILARAPYEILPQYDISGAGLLYCAAYPLIADISQMRAGGDGPRWAAETSTIERDTCYFANADLTAKLEWLLHGDEDGDGLSTDSSIVRDDGVAIASVRTRKAAL